MLRGQLDSSKLRCQPVFTFTSIQDISFQGDLDLQSVTTAAMAVPVKDFIV